MDEAGGAHRPELRGEVTGDHTHRGLPRLTPGNNRAHAALTLFCRKGVLLLGLGFLQFGLVEPADFSQIWLVFHGVCVCAAERKDASNENGAPQIPLCNTIPAINTKNPSLQKITNPVGVQPPAVH